MPQSQDTYVVVNPDGTVTFDFDGHVQADGVDMLAGDSGSPPEDRKIIWHRDTPTGAKVAEIFAWKDAVPTNNLISRANSPDGLKYAQVGSQATNAAQTLFATVGPSAALVLRTILRQDGASSFLQLLTQPENLRLAFGSVGITWPGGSPESTPQNIAHGLGVVPVWHVAFQADQSGVGGAWALGFTRTNVNITVAFRTSGFAPGAGVNGTCVWAAVG